MLRSFTCLIFIGFLFLNGETQGQQNDWSLRNEYFQAYSFSKRVEGLTIELGITTLTQNKFVDSVFFLVSETDSLPYVVGQHVGSCTMVDTSGRFVFYRNRTLEKKLLGEAKRTFFVYCTKGVVERTIQDVVFSVDQCISNIVVFRFAPIDKNKYGYPVFCTRKKLPLQYGPFPEANKSIQSMILKEKTDYTDSIKTIVFAQTDSLYYTYTDNFNWSGPSLKKCYFPGRGVYVKRKNKTYRRKWELSLDLFGVPCD